MEWGNLYALSLLIFEASLWNYRMKLVRSSLFYTKETGVEKSGPITPSFTVKNLQSYIFTPGIWLQSCVASTSGSATNRLPVHDIDLLCVMSKCQLQISNLGRAGPKGRFDRRNGHFSSVILKLFSVYNLLSQSTFQLKGSQIIRPEEGGDNSSW